MAAAGGGEQERSLGDVRELRLALVCYGGVSLAIYMHGVTKELHKLAVASAAFDRDQATNPWAAEPRSTERVYWELLARMRRGEVGPGRPGVRTRVVVDIISGTSAGGINGVCLAKALAGNLSQEPVRDVWMERGDIAQLLRGPRWLPPVLRGLWVVGSSLNRLSDVRPPLRGDRMCVWMHEAFAAMDAAPRPLPDADTLLPFDHSLDLFVPTTDFHGYEREIPLQDPKLLRDRTHRHVLSFHHERPGRSQFTAEYNHALAFAARATSSFPGAFPPVSVDDYDRAFPNGTNLRALLPDFFPLYELAGADPTRTAFIDGGVLDNAPFATSIATIDTKPASVEVDRRLVFVEPDPRAEAAGLPPGSAPSWHATIWGGYASIPRREPILDDLTDLARRNEHVARIRDVIETSFESVRARVDDVLVRELGGESGELPAPPAAATLAAWQDRVEQLALEQAGFGLATYLRLRIRSVVDAYARMIARAQQFPPDSYHAWFVTAVLRRWARDAGLLEQSPEATAGQRDFLDRFDLGYHERRIRFVLAAFNWWYLADEDESAPARAELDEAKERVYEHLGRLRALGESIVASPAVRAAVRTVFDPAEVRAAVVGEQLDTAAFATRHAADLRTLRDRTAARAAAELPGLERGLYEDLHKLSEGWSPEVRADLLVRYLGFPFWDVLIYPIEGLSGVGERDHVEVLRISPLEARLLSPLSGSQRLQGVSLAHFGAFFSRPGRENDYLWGRLDAAERLVALLLDDPRRPGTGDPQVGPCKEAFAAILADERHDLTRLDRRVGTHLTRQVAALAGDGVTVDEWAAPVSAGWRPWRGRRRRRARSRR